MATLGQILNYIIKQSYQRANFMIFISNIQYKCRWIQFCKLFRIANTKFMCLLTKLNDQLLVCINWYSVTVRFLIERLETFYSEANSYFLCLSLNLKRLLLSQNNLLYSFCYAYFHLFTHTSVDSPV